jgi:hypothetical protein
MADISQNEVFVWNLKAWKMLFVPHANLENIKMKGIALNINKRRNFDNFETLFIHVFWWKY